MKSLVNFVTGALGGDGARRLSASIALLLVLGAAPAAFSQEPPDSSPSDRPEEDDGDDDGASGDETVGTLPSVTDEDDGFDPVGIPGLAGLGRFHPDGSLTLEGPATDIAAILARTRGSGSCSVELLTGGDVRLRLLGDFRIAVRPELLARLDLKATLCVVAGHATRISGRKRSSEVLLAAASSLDIPLAGMAGSGDLQRAPLLIESVNVVGVRTRLAARIEGGLLVLTQERRD
jgi:hypothetical protein